MTNNDKKPPRQYLVTVTFFDNYAAKTKREEQLTLPNLAITIQNENRIEKNRLPWLKLAVFGEVKTAKGSLRHDANMQLISGVEVEHDSGRMSFDQAVQLLQAADIYCLIYTSPSHLVANEDGVAVEKWRVLAPTSELLPVADRYKLAARINGVLEGVATAESFTLSQSYYFGSVKHNPAHFAQVIDGEYFVDCCDDLDAGAIGAPVKVKGKAKASPQTGPEMAPSHTEAALDEFVRTANDINAHGDRQWHNNMRSVVASMVKKFKTDAEIYERCAPACREGYGDKDVKKLIDTARVKYEITDPETSSNEFIKLLGEFTEEVAASGEEPLKGWKQRKPVIRYGKLADMVDAAARTLIAADVPFYQRGGMLVRPVVMDLKTFNDGPTFSAQLVVVDVHYMADTLSRHADWVKFNKTEGKWVPANPPTAVCLALLAKFGDWPFRVLAGIITTQTLRPDGSILSEAGYDPATQLLLINPPAMRPIAEHPTVVDAEAALDVLCELLEEFPFTDNDELLSTSRAVGLSAIISTVCRGAYPVVPMHVVDAPAAGTGKSYLLSTVGWISTGQAMPVISAGKTVEETEKRLGAAVIAGQSLICIDNVEGELGGDALCQLIEQVRPSVRILGQSKLIEVDGRSMCFFANGNNISLVGDIYRRVVTCRLDAGVDRPEKRQFKKNPKAIILANRGHYVAACLTICRAYLAAGQPGRCPQIGSFNEWSNLVRSALVWLGEADCVDTMDNARADDPHRLAQQALLAQWRDTFGGRGMLLKDVIAKCNETIAGADFDRLGERAGMRHTYEELRQAVISTNPEAHRRVIDPHALGQKMRAYKDQWVGGMRFTKAERNQEILWYAEIKGERPEIKYKPVKGKSKISNEING